ncbi:unnamed protein product [Cochlearia groenlandica]
MVPSPLSSLTMRACSSETCLRPFGENPSLMCHFLHPRAPYEGCVMPSSTFNVFRQPRNFSTGKTFVNISAGLIEV